MRLVPWLGCVSIISPPTKQVTLSVRLSSRRGGGAGACLNRAAAARGSLISFSSINMAQVLSSNSLRARDSILAEDRSPLAANSQKRLSFRIPVGFPSPEKTVAASPSRTLDEGGAW